MAVNGVGNRAVAYIQQTARASARASQLDQARMQNQRDSLNKVIEYTYKLRNEQSEKVNQIKEAALEAQQGGIDTWA